MSELAIACMVRAALLARACGAPNMVGLVIRRRGWYPAPGAVVRRHVVEWDAGPADRGLVIADVAVLA